jgi:hypothetical protein
MWLRWLSDLNAQIGRLPTLAPQRRSHVKQLRHGTVRTQEERCMMALQLRSLRIHEHLRRAGGRQRSPGQVAAPFKACGVLLPPAFERRHVRP